MRGTLSLLIGAHQLILHPVCVVIAFRLLYRTWPTWRQLVCIVVHDWGYLGCADMDGLCGKRHPELGARIAGWLFGENERRWCLYHSRSQAKADGVEPSTLCWADKLASALLPWWAYLPGAWLSGELDEYRLLADTYWRETSGEHGVPLGAGHREWHAWMAGHMRRKAEGTSRTLDKLSLGTGQAGLLTLWTESWAFHLGVRPDHWVWGHETEAYDLCAELYGAGPLFLLVRFPGLENSRV